MEKRAPRSWKRAARGAIATALVAVALAGCGGDDGGEGTATSEVASTAPIVAETSTPVDLTAPSPAVGTSASANQQATPGGATPTPAIVVSAPPVVMPTPSPGGASPVASVSIATPISVISRILEAGAAGEASRAGDSPGGTPVATPSAVAVTEVVDSCAVASYPPYTGSDSIQVTTVDVFFRAGPGADCDALMEEPIGAGVSVEVLGDPVGREGSEFTWVAVSLDGVQGWLATEFLEPAPE